MRERPIPQFRHSPEILLAGTLSVYRSQADATEKIPLQWAELLARGIPEVDAARTLYGASPCTNDRQIHYLTGISVPNYEGVHAPDRLTLEEGEYAVFTVESMADLRDTWVWALTEWIASSGRRERKAPEFERYAAPYHPAKLAAPVELWIPLEDRTTG